MIYDYLLHDMEIIDGSGKPPQRGNIGIKDGRMYFLNDNVRITINANRVIKCKEMVATPGFIDMHSHSDLQYLQAPNDVKIRQGVTTELFGQDGLGVAPVEDKDRKLVAELTAGLLGQVPPDLWKWNTMAEYMNALEQRGLVNNVAILASHGPLRIKALGMSDRKATPKELEAMKALVRECMNLGAFGLSTGLIYPPCSYGDTEELIELNREVAKDNGIFVVHQRDEGYWLVRSFEEVTRIARESGVHLHVSHLQAYGRVNWPLIDQVLERADEFVEEGGKVTWDRYPYLAGCTVLTAVLPTWTLSEGTDALVRNLRDSVYRQRIHEEFTKGLDVWHNRQISVGWDNIVISAVTKPENKWMEGKDCLTLAQKLDKNPIDFVCDLLAEENLAVTMISHYGSPKILEKVLMHSQGTVGSDGIYCGRPHPRLYGTYPRFIREFAKEKKALSLPEAIHKITGLPASILGLKDRGLLKEGYQADIVVFDPDSIKDTATYDNPDSYPQGIEYVFVNGEMVVENGVYTGRLPGKVLRKNRD